MKKAIFYYFPYAGASAMSFKNMHGYFSDDVQTVCVEYSGHGKRIESPYPVSINDIATDAFKTITATDNEVPVYLGGHCLGAIVAYEVCLLFKKAGISAPAKLFISGQGAPDKIISEKLQTMNEEELLQCLAERNLIDSNMLDPRFRSFVRDLIQKPIINDSIIYDNYVCSKNEKISTSIELLYGEDDSRYPIEDMIRWKEFTDGNIETHSFHGGHYFIRTYEKDYFEMINNIIGKDIGRTL